MPDPPFKLDLKPLPYNGGIADSNGEGVAVTDGMTEDIENARRDWIIKCVNAHERLVAVAKRFRDECAEQIRIADGDENMIYPYAQDVAFIDAALALAETKEP